MSRFRQNDGDTESGGIDISPLIDVVFIMLIFFIVATTFVEDPGVDVDKPIAASRERLEKQSIYIALTSEGDIVYANRTIGVNGIQPVVRRMLDKEPSLPVIIEADATAQSGTLFQVITQVKLAGAEKVSLATQLTGN